MTPTSYPFLNLFLSHFNLFLLIMAALAIVVFVALNFIEAGYGITINKKWGATIGNKTAWACMEIPVFVAMAVLWLISERTWLPVPFILFILFQIHYFRRAFIFPFRLKGKGRMPVLIMLMGVIFNICNALMQGGWIFFLSPAEMYQISWLSTPQFIVGTIIFFFGMGVNIQSDNIIRNLRKPGDSNHYLPSKGLFKYVTGAHYFGEIVEWIGFAILTWSLSGAVFALWTFANLVPRANAVYHKYQHIFGAETLQKRHLKRVFPFIY